MATPIPNIFTSFSLTKLEEETATVLGELQKMRLLTKRAEIATQKLNLLYDPQNPTDFNLQVVYLSGQLDIISFLLDESEAMETLLRERAATSSQ